MPLPTVVAMRADGRPGPGQQLVLRVTGMACRHCVREVTALLRDVAGVETVEADATTCRVRLCGSFAVADVLSALQRSGDAVEVLAEHTQPPPQGDRQ